MKKIDINDSFDLLMNGLDNNGAFLNTYNTTQNQPNTMTIGWATLGRAWGELSLTVWVRYSRHTYDILKDMPVFTVSVPKNDSLNTALMICGTKSGKDADKFKLAEIDYIKGYLSGSIIIKQAYLHFECETAYIQSMEPTGIKADYIHAKYEHNNDYHIMFVGTIRNCYITE
jgi:flavin reductase (DIM6/NTAB) family NADH-FMN oxidoreductase RutF